MTATNLALLSHALHWPGWKWNLSRPSRTSVRPLRRLFMFGPHNLNADHLAVAGHVELLRSVEAEQLDPAIDAPADALEEPRVADLRHFTLGGLLPLGPFLPSLLAGELALDRLG